MSQTCYDCHTPRTKVVNGKHISFCPKKNKRVYPDSTPACGDIDPKIIGEMKPQKWGMVTRIQTRISRHEEITY